MHGYNQLVITHSLDIHSCCTAIDVQQIAHRALAIKTPLAVSIRYERGRENILAQPVKICCITPGYILVSARFIASPRNQKINNVPFARPSYYTTRVFTTLLVLLLLFVL